ncbi:MAG: PhoU domain-containing protein, partial [Candidatus Bathyarchaeota archaeon]
SLVVSLPKSWIKMHRLKKGDDVSLDIKQDHSLLISPDVKKERESKECTLNVDANEKATSLARKIIGCYLNGYSRVKVLSEKIFSVTQRKAIRNIVRILYMRIMEADSKTMLIQTLIDESRASLDLAIQRMQLISRSICREALEALKKQDAMLAKSTFSLDDDVDHFSFFLIRLLRDAAQDSTLANQLEVDALECMDYQTLVYRVEYAADQAANIAKQIVMLKGSGLEILDELLTLLFTAGTEAVDLYEKALAAFSSRNVEDSINVIEQKKRIEELDRRIASMTFMKKQKNAIIVCSICSIRGSIKGIADCAVNIAEVAINWAYRRPIY